MTKHTLIAAIFGLALLTASARSQDLGGRPGSYAVNGDDSLVMLMPELRTAKAPQWLKPGLRLTWYIASASIPGAYIGGLTQDPDGVWRNHATGTSFRSDDAASASGQGYMELDVIAVHDDVVVVAHASHTLDGAVDGPSHPGDTGAFSTPSGYLSGFWVHPQVLAKHTDLAGAGILAARTQYPFGGHQLDAFWTSIKTANGSTSSVSDLASGLMLHAGMATSTAPNSVNLNGVATNIGGVTNLAQMTFRGMRQLQIPWAGAPLPAAVANVHKLVYRGSIAITVPGTFPTSFAWSMENVITGRGKDFLQGTRTTATDAGAGFPITKTSEFVTGCNQLTPLAIPPEHLAKLVQGQVLDRDPVTKITTTVTFVGRDPRGNDVAVLSSSQGPGLYRTDYIYDRTSGILAGAISTDPTLHMQMTLFLTGRE